MEKAADAFRSIGEVARIIGVAPHVLRYWETQFPQLKPVKRRDGRRYYRPEDLQLVAGLCEVLREEGLTIRGARKLLAKDRGEAVRQRGIARLGDLAAPAEQTGDIVVEMTNPVSRPAPVDHAPAPVDWLAQLAATAAALRALPPERLRTTPTARQLVAQVRDRLADRL